MKTPSIIKHTTILLSTAVLPALPAHAVQNFNKTKSYTAGDSNFGASASFFARDNSVAPNGTTLGSYAVTAGGTVTGKILTKSVTALNGTGTVTVKSNGTGTFSGSLSAIGVSVLNVSNKALPYSSPHFVKKWSASKSIPFSIFFIPFNVTAKVNASVDAFFRVDTSSTPSAFAGAMPRIEIKMGPVADMAASAEASVGAGIKGFASLSVGASGSLKLGKAAITANATVFPTFPVLTAGNLLPAARLVTPVAGAVAVLGPVVALKPNGASVTVSLTADTAGLTGSLDVFAEAEVFLLGSHRVTKNIAKYSSAPATVTLLGPVTYKWF